MIEAWLEAIEEKLRLVLNSATEVGWQPDGHPPATMGARYVSLDEGSVQGGGDTCLKETYTVFVWCTVRANVLPADRGKLLKSGFLQSLSLLERKVITAIHGKQDLRILANQKLGISLAALEGNAAAPGGDGAYGDAFQHPLWYTGRGTTARELGDWIGSKDATGLFLVRKLPFVGGLRVQSLDIQA